MSIDRSVAVGVEINGGGTTVALIDRHGRLLHQNRAKTLRGRPAMATLDPYLRAVEEILTRARLEGLHVKGIGISIPGSLEQNARRPQLVPVLPSLNGFPLCDLLEARYRLPTLMNVDVDAALLGEHQFGSGQGFRRILYLKVNAVVGASFLIDGQLERSGQQYIGHICHLLVSTNGPRCSCGKRGCINTLVSTEAMQKIVQRALRRGEETTLTQRLLNREYLSPQLLAEEAIRGDSVALQVYGEMGRWLSEAVSRYMILFEPHAMILSGGLLGASDLLLSRVRTTVNTAMNTNSRVCSMIEIIPGYLGNNAALIGAVAPLF